MSPQDLLRAAIENRRANPNPDPPKPTPVPLGTSLVAPIGIGFTGFGAKKPFHHKVTVCVPHLNTPEQLKLAIGLWRCQTVKPYICVTDTGSPWDVCEDLEKNLRADDVEVHFIRGHGYKHSSEPVTAALDLAHTRCQTEYLFHTHADVFPLRRDFLEYMLTKCTHLEPLVGWQMSPRNTSRGSASQAEWKECVSHTATMVHMPTAHRGRLTWSMEAYYAHRPTERGNTIGWPDTESPFMLACKANKIKPLFLGTEPNFQYHEITSEGQAWAVHARSFTGLKLENNDTDPRWKRAKEYMAKAEGEARLRLRSWTDPQGCQFRSAEPTGTVKCPSCRGHVELKTFDCSKHGKCMIGREAEGCRNCSTCPDRMN